MMIIASVIKIRRPKPFGQFSLLLLLLHCLIGCGGPSPWVNWVAKSQNLTRKNLERLGQSYEEFESFSVGLIADPQATPGFLRMVSERLNDRDDLSFTLILGDLTDRSLKTEFLWVADVVTGARRPMLTVVGNHDGLLYGEDIYKDVFGRLNYSFLFRGVNFIVWNNNPYEWGYPDFDWLRSEVESFPRAIIVSHQPPGSIERYVQANDELRDVYKHPHVMGSVHGHIHRFGFERIADKPVMSVSRVDDEEYGVMHVLEDASVNFEKCQRKKCQTVK